LSNEIKSVTLNTIKDNKHICGQKKQDIAYFLSFCIEQYKKEKGMNGVEVLDTFTKYGVLDYLNNHFEILHTQSRQWVLEDIDEYINTRKGENK
jgi:hypothetical protein